MKPRFFELARRMTMYSCHTKHRIGAVLVQKNHVVSVGANRSTQTHPKSTNRWRSIHAELDAILGVPAWRLRGSTIYVVRVTKSGLLAHSKPCADCAAMLIAAKVHRFCYIGPTREFRSELAI